MKRLLATQKGVEVIAGSQEIRKAIHRFMDPTIPEPRSIRDSEGSAPIYQGRHSTIYAVGDAAVKLSLNVSKESYNQANLIRQLGFMSQLSRYLDAHYAEVSTPRQFFAAENDYGDQLLGMERLDYWQSLTSLLIDQGTLDVSEQQRIGSAVKERIASVVRSFIIFMGINNLGGIFDGRNVDGIFNVMVPRYGDSPETGPLCIIDQPGIASEEGLVRGTVGYASATYLGRSANLVHLDVGQLAT